MARKVDPVLEARRRRVLDAVGQASYLIDRVRPRCHDLQRETWAEVSGTVIGDELVAAAARSAEGLEQLAGLLGEISATASAIDVTVEVPDEEESR
ncbi:hypothetical protein [Acidipropionibacterium virtanenii]|uniref:Uncharacterized protein n=1 Tax=Acidipropionibacterium virtanenii TaxID=2057246 RepID=A0A344UT49_9ACTN|nr:hypothetical protein [Acidipropionibacterium virtanenii]AXE38447.1 hypothetical protein JS278_01271 [Acidipropionibacterium virtanenii]